MYNTLCYALHGQGKIVLCVASSGIASLLLIGCRTAHSTLKIPIEIHEGSTCSIGRNSDLSKLIRVADLVIWDEAPMQEHHVHEAVDRSFRGVLRCDHKPSGGLCVVFGGVSKQILPVIIKGSCAEIVGACLQRSRLWLDIKALKLTNNMCLNTDVQAERDFSKWQLEVGHGQHTDDLGKITLPDHFKCTENTVASLIQTIYPAINSLPLPPDSYVAEQK